MTEHFSGGKVMNRDTRSLLKYCLALNQYVANDVSLAGKQCRPMKLCGDRCEIEKSYGQLQVIKKNNEKDCLIQLGFTWTLVF